MLRLPAGLLALTILVAAGALPATAWAQPAKPKPAAPATAENDTADEAEDSAGTGKKVKTEGEKAEIVKTKPRPAAEDGADPAPGKPVPPSPAPAVKPGSSTPPRDR